MCLQCYIIAAEICDVWNMPVVTSHIVLSLIFFLSAQDSYNFFHLLPFCFIFILLICSFFLLVIKWGEHTIIYYLFVPTNKTGFTVSCYGEIRDAGCLHIVYTQLILFII